MPGPKSDKQWSDALRRAVHRESAGKGSPKWLDVIANRCVEAAADGDMSAMKELGDRLDGRPAQAIQGTGDQGEHMLVHKVVFEVVKAKGDSA